MLKGITFWVMLWFLLFVNLDTGFAQSPAAECGNCGPHILGCFDLWVDVSKPKDEKEISKLQEVRHAKNIMDLVGVTFNGSCFGCGQ